MNIEMIPASGGETLWVVADRIRFLGGLAGSRLDLIEVEIPPGSGTPPHSHASAELMHVIEGDLTVRQFAPGQPPQTMALAAGATVRIPSMAVHNYSNDSAGPVRMLVLIEASMTAFFRDIGTIEPQAQPDFARIGAAMKRHGIEALAA